MTIKPHSNGMAVEEESVTFGFTVSAGPKPIWERYTTLTINAAAYTLIVDTKRTAMRRLGYNREVRQGFICLRSSLH